MKISMVIVFVICSNIVFGQDLYVQLNQSFGISKFDGTSLEYKYMISDQSSALIGINILNSVSIESGISYQNAGGKIIWTDDFINGNLVTHNDYIELDYLKIPLALKYTFGEKLQFAIKAGIYYSIHLKAVFGTDYNETFSWFTSQDQLRSNDYGIQIIPSISFKIRPQSSICLSIEQEKGFVKIVPYSTNLNTYISLGFKMEI